MNKKGVILMARRFGYARVSSVDQNLGRQVEALLPYVDNNPDNILCDKKSGKDMDREKLQALKLLLGKGDILYVASLDRLGRNKEDIKEILKHFHGKGVSVKILDLPTSMIDVKDEISAQTLDLVNGILIDVLGYVAEMERKFIRKRQREGIELAKAQGKRLGRLPKALPETWEQDIEEWNNGKCTAISLIRKYQVAPATFYKNAKEWEKQHKKD